MRLLRTAAPVAAIAAGLTAAYARLSGQSVINSDGANEVLQGLDFWHGNVLLHGWWLAADTFYLTDAPLYGLIARLQGTGPWVVHEAAGFVAAVAVVGAALLARGTRPGAAGWVAAGTAAVLLCLPPALLLQGQMHILGVTFVLAGLLLVERRPDSVVSLAAAGLLMAAAMASDPLVTGLFAPPIAIVAAVRARVIPSERRRDLLLLGTVAAAVVAALAIPSLVQALGGFERPQPLRVGLASPSVLATNLGLTVRGLLLVFDADFVDAPQTGLVVWVRLLAVAAVATGLVLAARRLRSRASEDLVPQILLVVVALNLAVFLFSTQPFSLASARFLSPLALAGAVLAGRTLGPLLVRPPLRAPAAAGAAVLLATLPVQLSRPNAAAPTAQLERWLESRGLRRGLGSYWEASIVTLDTRGLVTVRCVDGPSAEGTRATPKRWFQARSWFVAEPGRPADFVVFSPGEYPADIDEARAIAAFGRPVEIDHVGRYEVMVYGRDLLADLAS